MSELEKEIAQLRTEVQELTERVTELDDRAWKFQKYAWMLTVVATTSIVATAIVFGIHPREVAREIASDTAKTAATEVADRIATSIADFTARRVATATATRVASATATTTAKAESEKVAKEVAARVTGPAVSNVVDSLTTTARAAAQATAQETAKKVAYDTAIRQARETAMRVAEKAAQVEAVLAAKHAARIEVAKEVLHQVPEAVTKRVNAHLNDDMTIKELSRLNEDAQAHAAAIAGILSKLNADGSAALAKMAVDTDGRVVLNGTLKVQGGITSHDVAVVAPTASRETLISLSAFRRDESIVGGLIQLHSPTATEDSLPPLVLRNVERDVSILGASSRSESAFAIETKDDEGQLFVASGTNTLLLLPNQLDINDGGTRGRNRINLTTQSDNSSLFLYGRGDNFASVKATAEDADLMLKRIGKSTAIHARTHTGVPGEEIAFVQVTGKNAKGTADVRLDVRGHDNRFLQK